MNRIDIHIHSRFSNLRLRDALPTPEALIDKAIELGLKGISITDHDSLSAHIKTNRYAQEIKKDYPDFKVILGNEIYLVNERPNDEHYHFLLNSKDEIGHYQLRRLSSLAWLNSYTRRGLTRVDTLKSELEMIVKENPGHLIASTACIGGELGKNILKLTKAEKIGDKESAEEAYNAIVNFIIWCKELFKDDFYLEVQPGISSEQIIVNRRMVSIAQCFGIKMIPTSDAHYLRPEDRYVHKAYLNSENKEREVDAFYQDAFLHTNEEMIEKFKKSDYDELFVKQMFNNTIEIYDKISDYSLHHSQQVPLVEVEYFEKTNPAEDILKYPRLAEMFNSEDKIDRYWINKCVSKLKEIGKYNDIYLSELEEEAEIKTVVGERLSTNMFAYPITLSHYIDEIWNKCESTVGIGRGSACAALNHYLLGITQLDPIEWNFPMFRYMNRDTSEPGDIDIDVCSSRVSYIIDSIKKDRAKNFDRNKLTQIELDNLGANYVCTFGTESSKSCVLTSARGYRSEEYPMGIDVDTAQYLSSLIPVERGFVWSITDTYYGNPEKDRKRVNSFKNEIDKYPGLLDVMLGIEGNISRRGRHASGVLFLNEDPYEFNAFMKTPSGEVVTQYDLHDAEWAGSLKMDILVTEIQDKIKTSIKLLQEDNLIEPYLTLREAYDKYLHPNILPIDDLKYWDEIDKAEILDMFQLDSPIGRQGTKKIKPNSMIELSSVNALIRLMTTEKGQETWIDKYLRYKLDKNEYYNDIQKYNLTENEFKAIEKYTKMTLGLGISQEQLMRVLMDEEICGFTLAEANAARKVVSKKKLKEIPKLREKMLSTAKSEGLAKYIWDLVVAPQLSYSFSDIHSLGYSFIGFQSAYIATHWNPIYWNTACLIINSGSLEDSSEEEIVNINALEKEDMKEGVTFIDLPDRSGKIKKTSSTDYVKMAKALGNIMSNGIKVSLVDINKSSYSFKPDIENNFILFGMKGLNRVGDPVIEKIMQGRPYSGIIDFMNRCPLNKSAMISLIKAGAFDELDAHWAKSIHKEPRIGIMSYYISKICEPKKKITLANFRGLIENDLIPEYLEFQKRVYVFNKYLKDYTKVGQYYVFNESCYDFYNQFFDVDQLESINGYICIVQKTWDNIYKKTMDEAREWIKDNQSQILNDYNKILFKQSWEDDAKGNISSWEMESLCFYYHNHELKNIRTIEYGIKDFYSLNSSPDIEKYWKRKEMQIPIYKIYRIAGTVIGKDDTRSTVYLLTTSGVVNVKFSKEHYAMYNKRISEIQEDGKKKVRENGWFSRGTLLIVSGYRRDDTFNVKTYKNTEGHSVYKITEVKDNGKIVVTHKRYGENEDDRN